MNEILSKEELSKIIDKMAKDDILCKYCEYQLFYDCNCEDWVKSDGSGNPIYPYCADNDMKNGEIDVYQYLEDIQIESKIDLQMILDQQ